MHLQRTSNQLTNERNSAGPPVELNGDSTFVSDVGWTNAQDAWRFDPEGLIGNGNQGVIYRTAEENLIDGMEVDYHIVFQNPNGVSVTFSLGGNTVLTSNATPTVDASGTITLAGVANQRVQVNNTNGDIDGPIVSLYSLTTSG